MQKILFSKALPLIVALTISFIAGCGSDRSAKPDVKVSPSTDAPGGISIVCFGDDVYDYPSPPPYDPSKKRMRGAKLKVTDEAGKTVATGATDEQGRFETMLPPGAYRVEITGKWLEAEADIRLKPGKTASLEMRGGSKRRR
ncbi:MAG: carboxypeptidase-like regulatory domain-containing protein [Gemmataceae bacterium]